MPKYSKYMNKKITLSGFTFDSHKEAQRFLELKIMQRAGEITDLQRQVPFDLIPAQKDKDGRTLERATRYIADFVYIDEAGRKVVEDVKCVATAADPTYVINRKLMLWRHGIRVREV